MSDRNRRFKDDLYTQLARVGKAVASPRRLELLDLLCQSPRPVEKLAQLADLTVANTSQHLQVLRGAGLVQADRQGVRVVYRPAQPEVCELLAELRRLAEARLAEIEKVTRVFHESRGTMERITKDELIERVQQGEVTLLDVRPREEYEAGHISGAVSVPLGELQRWLSHLERDRQVVAYCRGPFCVLAVEAVELLRSRGFDAVRLEDGVVEWAQAGLPVAYGEQ